MRFKMKRPHNQGQGMSEYIIIIALIAITSIAAIQIFGNSIKYQMSKTVQNFLGDDAIVVTKPRARKSAFEARSLADFDKANENSSSDDDGGDGE